jgi:hypothetical protein
MLAKKSYIDFHVIWRFPLNTSRLTSYNGILQSDRSAKATRCLVLLDVGTNRICHTRGIPQVKTCLCNMPNSRNHVAHYGLLSKVHQCETPHSRNRTTYGVPLSNPTSAICQTQQIAWLFGLSFLPNRM